MAKSSRQSGFTLVEILIATLIFAWIAAETTRAIRNSQTNKARVDEDIDTYQAVRSAFQIIRKDLSNVFHLNAADFLPYGHLLPEDRPETPVNLKDPNNYKSYIEQNFQGLSYKSYFIGEPSELHFSSLSHFRVYADKPESEQAEISYTTEIDAQDKSILHLYKRESAVIDEKYDEGGKNYLILEDLSAIKFRYYNAGKDEWADRWDTHQEPNVDELPSLIEVKIVINSRHPLNPDEITKLEIVTSFRPMFMNSYHQARIGGLEPLEKALQPKAQGTNTGAGTSTSTGTNTGT